jgi:hypothetical protein
MRRRFADQERAVAAVSSGSVREDQRTCLTTAAAPGRADPTTIEPD